LFELTTKNSPFKITVNVSILTYFDTSYNRETKTAALFAGYGVNMSQLHDFHHYYEFSDFRPGPIQDEEHVFQVHSGLAMCLNERIEITLWQSCK